ncbi:MAG: hypothetical protein KIT11_11900 [Fimbriimonadaceae bacterium]|nr:hypothetical protein [Fimbriimonadaceae bacterium]QYK55262.1 MAG: hypothetical protein KF733_09635 [Fimbriimonadaceae bacterium]
MNGERTIWEKLQAIDRRILYAILVVVVSIPLFVPATIPVDPDPSSKDMYKALMDVPPNKTVFIQSDWTVSTRGESQGHLEGLLRIVMARKLKFAIYSVADPQAPQVFRNVISQLNLERQRIGLEPYRSWEDYLDLSYFPNAEGTLNAVAFDVRQAIGSRRVKDPAGVERPIFESPVLRSVRKIGDAGLYVVVTASASIDIAIQRLSRKTRLSAMTTGVTGPQVLPFWQSGQVVGVAIGLKGVYDVEYMMRYGLNVPDETGNIIVPFPQKSNVSAPSLRSIEPNTITFARGQKYYLAFHVAIALLITAVVVGNIGMIQVRRAKR